MVFDLTMSTRLDFSLTELAEQQPDAQVDNNRSRKTLLASIVSIRLVMFHVYFLEYVGRPPGKSLDQIADSYDKLYGRPNNVTKDHFLRAIKDIISIDDWEYGVISLFLLTNSDLL